MKLVPPTETIETYRYRLHKNMIINGSLVLKANKNTVNYYPDSLGVPSIVFYFANNETAEWVFDDSELRDTIFDTLEF